MKGRKEAKRLERMKEEVNRLQRRKRKSKIIGMVKKVRESSELDIQADTNLLILNKSDQS